MRALALIDGEHYAPVVRDALAEMPYDVVGALLVGGTEKLVGGDEYGVPLAADLEEALAASTPRWRRPLGRAGARDRASASGSRAGSSRSASRTKAPTSRFVRSGATSRSTFPRSP